MYNIKIFEGCTQMAGSGRRRSEYRILKDREHEEQRQNRAQIIQEGFQMLEEIDEAVTDKKHTRFE